MVTTPSKTRDKAKGTKNLPLLLAGGGGIQALSNAMTIGALPFAMVMVLMCIALAKALYRDGLRDKHGVIEPVPAER